MSRVMSSRGGCGCRRPAAGWRRTGPQHLCPSAGPQNSDTHGSSVGVGAGSGEVRNVGGSPSGRRGCAGKHHCSHQDAHSTWIAWTWAGARRRGPSKDSRAAPQRRGATSSRPRDNVPRGRPGGGHTPALSNPHRAGFSPGAETITRSGLSERTLTRQPARKARRRRAVRVVLRRRGRRWSHPARERLRVLGLSG
jgi:hypothetical protein